MKPKSNLKNAQSKVILLSRQATNNTINKTRNTLVLFTWRRPPYKKFPQTSKNSRRENQVVTGKGRETAKTIQCFLFHLDTYFAEGLALIISINSSTVGCRLWFQPASFKRIKNSSFKVTEWGALSVDLNLIIWSWCFRFRRKPVMTGTGVETGKEKKSKKNLNM